MYDAVLAGAIALDGIEETLSINNMSLSDLSYNDSNITDAISNVLNTTNFTGVSGKVSFVNRSRNGVLALYQYVVVNGAAVKRLLALYNVNETRSIINNLAFLPGREPQWAGNRTSHPLDRSRTDVIYLLQPNFAPVVYTFTALTAAAIVMDIILFLFNLFTARMK